MAILSRDVFYAQMLGFIVAIKRAEVDGLITGKIGNDIATNAAENMSTLLVGHDLDSVSLKNLGKYKSELLAVYQLVTHARGMTLAG